MLVRVLVDEVRATDATISLVFRDTDATKAGHHLDPMLQESKERLGATGELGRCYSRAAAKQGVRSVLVLVYLTCSIRSQVRPPRSRSEKVCLLYRYVAEERAFRIRSDLRLDACLVAALQHATLGEDETPMGEALRQSRTVSIGDFAALPISSLRSAGLAAGCRSVSLVPLIGTGGRSEFFFFAA